MTTEPIAFSIVIPTYNRETFIEATLQSLLRQDFASFEILVVDDGSTDETERVVKSIQDSRIQYCKKKNGERGAARNFGAARAMGQYINFFDSDDLAYPNHLSTAHRVIQTLKHPEVFHLGYDVKDTAGRTELIRNNFPRSVNEMLINGNHLSCNGVFIRCDIALTNSFSEDRVLSASEDYELWLKLAARFVFYGDNTVTSSVINHTGRSVVTTDGYKLKLRIETLVHNLLHDLPFTVYYGDKLGVFQAYLYVYVGLHLAIANAPATESMAYLRKAVRLYPPVFFSKRFMAVLKTLIRAKFSYDKVSKALLAY